MDRVTIYPREMMTITIRKAREEDSRAIYDSHQSSIRNICINDYTIEQVEAWAGRKYDPDRWSKTIQRDYVWVVEVDHEVHGFGHFRILDQNIGQVNGLYFDERARGHGAGRLIFQKMKEVAELKGLKKIVLQSTVTSKGFYEKIGFTCTGLKGQLEIRGQSIEYHPMEMILTSEQLILQAYNLHKGPFVERVLKQEKNNK